MNRKSGTHRYFVYRIQLEKLKQKTLVLMVLAKVLSFLAMLITYYLRQS
jgi:hypothetical protein